MATTRGDLRAAVIALQGQIPETMQHSLGTINHVLACAQFAQEEVGEHLAGTVSGGDDALVCTLLLSVVRLESRIEVSEGRIGVPVDSVMALFSEFIV